MISTWVTSRKNWKDPIIIFQVIALARPWVKNKCWEGLNVCMNYEFNLLHHVGVVAQRVRAAAAETAAHEGDDNTPLGTTGVKSHCLQ